MQPRAPESRHSVIGRIAFQRARVLTARSISDDAGEAEAAGSSSGGGEQQRGLENATAGGAAKRGVGEAGSRSLQQARTEHLAMNALRRMSSPTPLTLGMHREAVRTFVLRTRSVQYCACGNRMGGATGHAGTPLA